MQSGFKNYDDEVYKMIRYVYADAYYFMSTTMSCIGYGEITP